MLPSLPLLQGTFWGGKNSCPRAASIVYSLGSGNDVYPALQVLGGKNSCLRAASESSSVVGNVLG